MVAGSDKKTVQQKLVEIQKQLSVAKTGKGRFGDFINLQDMLTALKPLLEKHGLVLILDNEIIEVIGRSYVQVTASLSDGDSVISAKAQAWEGDISRGLDSSQVTGSASTYARKYALAGLFAITDGSTDADSHKTAPEPAQTPAVRSDNAPVTASEKQQLKNVMAGLGMHSDEMGEFIAEVLGKATVDTYSDWRAIVDALENRDKDETV